MGVGLHTPPPGASLLGFYSMYWLGNRLRLLFAAMHQIALQSTRPSWSGAHVNSDSVTWKGRIGGDVLSAVKFSSIQLLDFCAFVHNKHHV